MFNVDGASLRHAAIAQQVERILGKDEVTSSNLVSSFLFPEVFWISGFFYRNAADIVPVHGGYLMKKAAVPRVTTFILTCMIMLICVPSLIMADFGLPVINIQLKGTTLEEINSGSKEIKYPGNGLVILDADDNIILDQDDVEVKGRGNTTWDRVKKPYQVKFSKKQDIFLLGKSKKWVLLANYMYPTFLRNELAFSIARKAGIKGTTDGEFVWLGFGPDELGLYYLCHKASVGSESLDLSDNLGVLLELDQPYMDEEIDFYSAAGDHFNLKDAVSDDVDEQLRGVKAFEERWNSLEAAARDKDWEKVCDEADVMSFARYYLLSELSMNLDATVTSFFMYMDGPDDTIHAGPAWDYDMCFGNMWKMPTQRLWCYNSLHTDVDPTSHILQELMDIPQFRSLTAQLWRTQMHPIVIEAIEGLKDKAEYIRAAVTADHLLWGENDFDSALAELSSWTLAHTDSMDNWFSGSAVIDDGEYYLVSEGLCLSADGLADSFVPVRLTLADDGYYTITSGDGELFLTGSTVPDEVYGTPVFQRRMYTNSQKWKAQTADSGVRFFNKDSGLYLCIVDGVLTEQYPGKNAVDAAVFTLGSPDDDNVLVNSFVRRLYSCFFGRNVDDEGLRTWSNNLIMGQPASKIVADITGSQEFLSKDISDDEHVRLLYRALLDREAADTEVSIWTDVLEHGYTRRKIIEGVANSVEYRALCKAYGIVAGKYISDDILDVHNDYARFVIRLYDSLLDRRFDEYGLRAWVQHLSDGVPHQRVLISFACSGEFKNRNMSDSDKVRALFWAALLREPTEDELVRYIQSMRMAGTELTVLLLTKEYGIVR